MAKHNFFIIVIFFANFNSGFGCGPSIGEGLGEFLEQIAKINETVGTATAPPRNPFASTISEDYEATTNTLGSIGSTVPTGSITTNEPLGTSENGSTTGSSVTDSSNTDVSTIAVSTTDGSTADISITDGSSGSTIAVSTTDGSTADFSTIAENLDDSTL